MKKLRRVEIAWSRFMCLFSCGNPKNRTLGRRGCAAPLRKIVLSFAFRLAFGFDPLPSTQGEKGTVKKQSHPQISTLTIDAVEMSPELASPLLFAYRVCVLRFLLSNDFQQGWFQICWNPEAKAVFCFFNASGLDMFEQCWPVRVIVLFTPVKDVLGNTTEMLGMHAVGHGPRWSLFVEEGS